MALSLQGNKYNKYDKMKKKNSIVIKKYKKKKIIKYDEYCIKIY